MTGWNESALDLYLGAMRRAGGMRSGAYDLLWDAAKREDWARGRVKAAGKSWDTHLAKMDGTVLPR